MAQKKPSFSHLEQLVETGQATSEQEDAYYQMLKYGKRRSGKTEFIASPCNGWHDMSAFV